MVIESASKEFTWDYMRSTWDLHEIYMGLEGEKIFLEGKIFHVVTFNLHFFYIKSTWDLHDPM